MNYITGTLKDVKRGVRIPWDPSSEDLTITTDSTTGSEDRVDVGFWDKHGDRGGGINIWFYSPIEYDLPWCTFSTPFPTTPPEEQDKTWRIRYDQQALTVWCNDLKVLDVILSEECHRSDWRTFWERETTKIQFFSTDTASDQYCYTPCKYIAVMVNFHHSI